MNKWLKYLIVAIVWTAILAVLEWLGVTRGHWKYAIEIKSLGVWSFLVYYPLVFVAGYAMAAIVCAEITKESHWFHDGLITFSLGSIMAMSMQVSRVLDIFGYQGDWNAVDCWILQTSQIVILQILLGRIYFSKLWRQRGEPRYF